MRKASALAAGYASLASEHPGKSVRMRCQKLLGLTVGAMHLSQTGRQEDLSRIGKGENRPTPKKGVKDRTSPKTLAAGVAAARSYNPLLTHKARLTLSNVSMTTFGRSAEEDLPEYRQPSPSTSLV